MSAISNFVTDAGFNVTVEDRVASSTSSKGNQIKWRRSDGIWAKADALGYEGLAEQTAGVLLASSNITDYVEYASCKIIEDETEYVGCVSADFLAPDETLITVARLFELDALDYNADMSAMTATERLKYIITNLERITDIVGIGRWLGALLEFDAFILNEDRHLHNIAVIKKHTGAFRLMPIFDNGAAFLSDTGRDYPMSIPIKVGIRKVKSKPIATGFSKQIDAVAEAVGLSLKFSVPPETIRVASQAYADEVIARVQHIIDYQAQRYPHLFS